MSSDASDEELVAVTIEGIRGTTDEEARQEYVVLLAATADDRRLPIWIGWHEAATIAYKLEAKPGFARPLPHELLVAAVRALGGTVREIRIRELIEAAYYATVLLETPTGHTSDLEARPSDALNLALLTEAPIRVAARLFDAQPPPDRALEAEPLTAGQLWGAR